MYIPNKTYILIIFAVILLGSCETVSTSPEPNFAEDAGTYKLVEVASSEQCEAICKADHMNCRGSVSYQKDITKPDIICGLNNGRTKKSDFFPAPLAIPEQAKVIQTINKHRTQHGLKPVKFNVKLAMAAQNHADYLANTGIISTKYNDDQSFTYHITKQEYSFSVAVLSMATGQNTWQKAFTAIAEDPQTHNNLLMENVTEYGLGFTYEPKTTYAYYWVVLLAAPSAENN